MGFRWKQYLKCLGIRIWRLHNIMQKSSIQRSARIWMVCVSVGRKSWARAFRQRSIFPFLKLSLIFANRPIQFVFEGNPPPYLRGEAEGGVPERIKAPPNQKMENPFFIVDGQCYMWLIRKEVKHWKTGLPIKPKSPNKALKFPIKVDCSYCGCCQPQ